MKALITTVPFGVIDPTPIELMKTAGLEFVINPHNKRLTEEQLFDLVPDFDILIAGTEQITEKVINNAPNLKLISRVGIGLDSVDLAACRAKGVAVSYTPDAPSPAVAEMTIGLMISVLRNFHVANLGLHRETWQRHYGKRLEDLSIGLLGLGRIGSQVARHLKSFKPKSILVNRLQDQVPDDLVDTVKLVDFSTLIAESDLVSLHLPLTQATKGLISADELSSMKKGSVIINTSRGGIVDEDALASALQSGSIAGAAVDVFENEPYLGALTNIENCHLTCHMGSMSFDCRTRMEIEATREAVRFFKQQPLTSCVPESEFEVQLHSRLKDI